MKTAILITARLKSTRLPLKVLRPIVGRPMLSHLLDRLRLSSRASQIILCTSTVEQDDPLEAAAREEGVACYRGDPDDVLARMTRAAEAFGVDTVVSCTADNPFVDPVYIDKLIDYHLAEGNDYTKVDGLPFGTFSYAIAYDALVRACRVKTEQDTEVWGGYFTETGLFKTGVLKVADETVRRPEVRLTVDTPEDFELVSRIFDALYVEGEVFTLPQILDLYDSRPELQGINPHVAQKAAKPIKFDASLLP